MIIIYTVLGILLWAVIGLYIYYGTIAIRKTVTWIFNIKFDEDDNYTSANLVIGFLLIVISSETIIQIAFWLHYLPLN